MGKLVAASAKLATSAKHMDNTDTGLGDNKNNCFRMMLICMDLHRLFFWGHHKPKHVRRVEASK